MELSFGSKGVCPRKEREPKVLVEKPRPFGCRPKKVCSHWLRYVSPNPTSRKQRPRKNNQATRKQRKQPRTPGNNRHHPHRTSSFSARRGWGLDDLGQASPPAGEFLALSDRGQALAFGSLAAGWHHNCAVRRDQGGKRRAARGGRGRGSPLKKHTHTNKKKQGKSKERWLQKRPQLGSAQMCRCIRGRRSLGDFGARVKNGSSSLGATGISCWGDNSQGQCDVPVGEATYLQVAAGRVHSCGLFKVLPGQGPGRGKAKPLE